MSAKNLFPLVQALDGTPAAPDGTFGLSGRGGSTLVAGAAVVADSRVSADSDIVVYPAVAALPAAAAGILVIVARAAGTFTVNSMDPATGNLINTDVRAFRYVILN